MLEEKIKRFTPQIGEILQHHTSPDLKVAETSDWYYGLIKGVLERHGRIASQDPKDYLRKDFYKNAAKTVLSKTVRVLSRKPPRYLEIACYRHILGYRLSKDFGFDATHFDLCDRDLEIGREIALAEGFEDNVDRVTGDFHDLPFSDNYFDFSFISASIHHTRTPERIIGEAMRVLSDGGLFYSQREPCERLFCFYEFNANRAALFTPFEKKIQDHDMMRIISSPYPGARNADLFGRIENDHIPLELYYETFAKYGDLVEEVVYHDGLLTRPDKLILEKDHLDEPALRDFIADLLKREMEELHASFSRQDEILGYSLPGDNAIDEMAAKTASALKARPENKKTIAWQKAMAKIFGGSLRFVVRRNGNQGQRSDKKFRRSTTKVGHVQLDDAVYKHSGLNFWKRLLPDIQASSEDELFASSFPQSDWTSFVHPNGIRLMQSRSDEIEINPPLTQKSVLVMRYRVHVDNDQPYMRLRISFDGREIETIDIAQSEDRVMRLVYDKFDQPVSFKLTSIDDEPADGFSRMRVSILQSIPIDESAGS